MTPGNTLTRAHLISQNAIGCRWVFKTKNNHDGSVRYKARLAIKGHERTSLFETFAPWLNSPAFRSFLLLYAQNRWPLHHMDVVTTFLKPAVDGEIYMQLPESLEWPQPDCKRRLRSTFTRGPLRPFKLTNANSSMRSFNALECTNATGRG